MNGSSCRILLGDLYEMVSGLEKVIQIIFMQSFIDSLENLLELFEVFSRRSV